MLQIKDLEAGYGELQVLQGVDVTVNSNEIVALIGPNGAGKSTILKSVFNIASVNSGKISFNGESLRNLKTFELLSKGISYVPQGKINFGDLTVRENLELGGNGSFDRVFATFPVLREKIDDLAYSLSGGQQQQLALGRALMQNPSLLLLDEPTLGLSPLLQKELFNNLVMLKKGGLAILIVEQNAKKAIETANKTYLLENGKIVLSGGKEILENEKIKQVYLGGS